VSTKERKNDKREELRTALQRVELDFARQKKMKENALHAHAGNEHTKVG